MGMDSFLYLFGFSMGMNSIYTGSDMQGPSHLSNLNLRIPSWTSTAGAKASLNGQNLPLPAPGVNLFSL
jgi:hypothetical protein